MMWFRVLCGVLFLLYFTALVYALWHATRSLPDPNDWSADKGQLDVHSEEYRRLITGR